ncbi:MAG: ribosome assembly RNA-binding protein YhbY [Myxococcales bacterium]|nr:ribosome assembly RNA-binding protein YhbY [Myxococcales bacterium]
MGLRGKQTRYLRGLGNRLKPVVTVGKSGVTESTVASVQAALEDHELIKVRLLDSVEGDRKAIGPELAERAGAELVQVLGRTVLLFRPWPESPERGPSIVLPD